MKLELVHSDLCGPMKTSSMNDNKLATKAMNGKTPLEAWSGSKPSVKHLRKHDLRSISKELVITKDAENGETSDWFDVAGTTDADEVIKTKSLTSVYERCNLVFAKPKFFDVAAKVPEWIDALKSEISAIEKNGTWFLTDLPSGKHVIGVKWVYRTKFNPDGSIFKHKARLVVKGYAQIDGVDYGDTFAPVARLDTIRLLIAIAGQLGWNMFHLDVKSAFLNGELEEDIYVCQPESFVVPGKEHQVYKLKRALYGLKQARELDKDAYLLVISLYVDDLLVMGSNDKAVSEFKLSMQKEFEMSDLGLMSCFLGMEINQSKAGIFISENKSIVGSLLYMTATRPDLMFPATLLSRFLSSPADVHLGVAKRVLRYLKSTLGEGLNYLKMDNVVLTRYSDNDWAGSLDDMKSTSGYVFNLGSVCSIAENPVQHGRTKHINVKFHAIREAEKNPLMKMEFCSSEMQVANLMAKALLRNMILFLKHELGITNINLKVEY
ncbi:hypothetical protein GQ457_15G015760 [Hibiscus cannabinus]